MVAPCQATLGQPSAVLPSNQTWSLTHGHGMTVSIDLALAQPIQASKHDSASKNLIWCNHNDLTAVGTAVKANTQWGSVLRQTHSVDPKQSTSTAATAITNRSKPVHSDWSQHVYSRGPVKILCALRRHPCLMP